MKKQSFWAGMALLFLVGSCRKNSTDTPPPKAGYRIITKLACEESPEGKPWEHVEVAVRVAIQLADPDGQNARVIADTLLTRRRLSDYPVFPAHVPVSFQVPALDTVQNRLRYSYSKTYYQPGGGSSGFSALYVIEDLKPEMVYEVTVD